MEQTQRPSWLMNGGRINEVEFCRQFALERYLTCCSGTFFGPQGRISDEDALRREIYHVLRQYLYSGLSGKVESILETLRYECPQDGLEEKPEDIFVLPVANGTFRLDTQSFSPNQYLTRYRLPVEYYADAPEPKLWLKFIKELLEEEDIPTLQEFMGYCLIPSTLGQKMLIITGKGGEGKSRIGVVMKALLGNNMNVGSISKIEASPFARADLEHLLVMVDDDLRMDALKSTNYLKSIITAELPMDLEKKNIQSYQGKLNVRFLAFGNDSLQALHDRSHGFFRRQIILTAKEKDLSRKDDPYLGYALAQEKEGILLWCIQGLQRLMVNDFRFTMSKKARQNLLESMGRGNNIPEFLKSQGYIQQDPEGCISSRVLYELYKDWCMDNALVALNAGSFWTYLNQNLMAHGLRPSRSIPIGNGKRARGYTGIRPMNQF